MPVQRRGVFAERRARRDATALNDSGSEVSTLPLPFLPFSLVPISREYSRPIASNPPRRE